MESKPPSFWMQKFDVLVLAFFVLLFSAHALYGIGDGYAQRTSDLFAGALLGLLTGRISQTSNIKKPELPLIETPKEEHNV